MQYREQDCKQRWEAWQKMPNNPVIQDPESSEQNVPRELQPATDDKRVTGPEHSLMQCDKCRHRGRILVGPDLSGLIQQTIALPLGNGSTRHVIHTGIPP